MSDNRGALWTSQERRQLSDEMAQGKSLEEMVSIHGRTPWALIAQLQSLGLIVLRGWDYYPVGGDPWVTNTQIKTMEVNFDE